MTADVPRVRLTDEERVALDESLVDSGCHGFAGDHPELYAACERIVAAHTAAAVAEAVAAVAADLRRDHDMPPNKDSRSYSYRNGWWDGVHHAAKVAEKTARRALLPTDTEEEKR